MRKKKQDTFQKHSKNNIALMPHKAAADIFERSKAMVYIHCFKCKKKETLCTDSTLPAHFINKMTCDDHIMNMTLCYMNCA